MESNKALQHEVESLFFYLDITVNSSKVSKQPNLSLLIDISVDRT
jgi:hypothetical protein